MSEQTESSRHITESDAVYEARRGMRALYTTVPAEVARDVQQRVEAALAQVWDDALDAALIANRGRAVLMPQNPYRVTPSERGTPVTTECGAPRPTQDEVCGFALGRGRYCLGHPRFPMTHATMCPRFHAVTPSASTEEARDA